MSHACSVCSGWRCLRGCGRVLDCARLQERCSIKVPQHTCLLKRGQAHSVGNICRTPPAATATARRPWARRTRRHHDTHEPQGAAPQDNDMSSATVQPLSASQTFMCRQAHNHPIAARSASAAPECRDPVLVARQYEDLTHDPVATSSQLDMAWSMARQATECQALASWNSLAAQHMPTPSIAPVMHLTPPRPAGPPLTSWEVP